MSIWTKLFGGKKTDTQCAKCGGTFKWPVSFKSGPISIPSHIVDKAIYCPTCKKKFCIQCVRGKCPECGGSDFEYVSPEEPTDALSITSASSNVSEENDRGKNYSQRSKNYLNAVTTYADLKDTARGFPMSDFMRKSLYMTMQSKIPSEILIMCDEIRAEMKKGEKDMKTFISKLEDSFLERP
jgi:hypothetical protein